MSLDRQSIEKRDFPIGRRGYDPDAVDAHLGMLADEVDTLKRSRGGAAGVASAASEQVRLIVEAAEQSAGDIERDADLEARRIRQEARDAAEKVLADAGSTSRDHVGKVSEASSGMLERIDAMETELRSTLDALRASAARLTSDLSLLQGSVGELRTSTSGGFEPDDPADIEPEPAIVEVTEEVVVETVSEDAPEGQGNDEEGARLIALNMALNGTPRGEVEDYLAENYTLDDAAGLLDDVYARVG